MTRHFVNALFGALIESNLPPRICLSVQFATLNFNLVQVSTSNSNNRSEYNPFTVFTARPTVFFHVRQINIGDKIYQYIAPRKKKKDLVFLTRMKQPAVRV
jgi:hypothetical protein